MHHLPSCYEKDSIIAVGALNASCTGPAVSDDWGSSGGSNYGKDCVDIFAPGTHIYFNNSGEDVSKNGTSLAAPLVTGAAALLLSYYPYLSPVQLKYAIMDGGEALSTLNGKCASGKMLNIEGAITVFNDHTRLKVEQTVYDGTYVIGAQQNAFQVLSVDGSSTAKGAELETYEADGSAGQKFNIQYHSEDNGYYTIQNVNSGLYLEARDGGTASQTRIQQNVKTGNEEQKWAIIKYPVNFFDEGNNTYYIMNKKSFLVMDCKSWNIGNDNPVQLYPWHTDYITNTTNRNQGFVFFNEVDGPGIKEDYLFKLSPQICKYPKTYITNVGGNAELQETGTELRLARSTSGYKIVDANTEKVLTLEKGSSSKAVNLVFAADTNALYQQWQVKPCGDGTVRIISASTGASMDCYSGQYTAGTNLWTYAPNGTAAQRFFYLEPVTDRVDETLEYEVAMGSNISNVAVLCASANKPAAVPYTNGAVLYPFTFEYVKAVGLYVIRDKASGQVLTISSNGNVEFRNDTGADTQYWILKKADSRGTSYTLQNAYTGRHLRWNNASGQWTIYSDSVFVAGSGAYRFYLNVRPFADGEYIIRQKDTPGKAYQADTQIVNRGYPLQFQNYTDGSSQIFYIRFNPVMGSYGFESIYHPTYFINTLNMNIPALSLVGKGTNSGGYYWMMHPQSDGAYTVQRYAAEDQWWTLQQGKEICLSEYTGSALQQFSFVPVTDAVSPGFYHITFTDNSSRALGVSGDGSVSLQESATAQSFVPVKIYNSYMLVDYASGNALYVNADGSVRQAAIDSKDPAQFWQIKYVRDTNNNPTEQVNIISCLSMDCLTVASGQSGEVKMLPADGRDEQSFSMDSAAPRKMNIMGDVVLSADSSCDAAPQKGTDGSVPEGAPLQRSAWGAAGNRRRTFKLLYDDNGFCKIRDAESKLVLEEVDSGSASVVVLNQYDSQSRAQKWIVLMHTDGTQTYINAATGHCITLSGAQAGADAFDNSAAQKYRFITKWDVTQDGTITAEDALALRRYLAGAENLTSEQEYAADADDDGEVTALDSVILSRVLAGVEEVIDEDAVSAAAANIALPGDIDYEWLLTCSDEEFLTYLLGEDYASYCIRYTKIIE